MTASALFPTCTPLDVLPAVSPQEVPAMPLASVTMTASFRPPADGWPPVDMLGRPMGVDLVTVTVTACADGTAEAAGLVSLRSADSGVVWTERPHLMPAFVGGLVDNALDTARDVVRGAR